MKRKVTEQSAAARELAQRLTGSDEVLLVWHPEVDRVEVSVRDVVTGVGFHVEVAPDKAIDAFYHPYAYAAARRDFDLLDRNEATIVNGDRRG